MSAVPDLFTHGTAEDWLLTRLWQLRCPVPEGPDPLQDRIRAAITAAGLGPLIAGRRPDGKGAETLEEAFERIFCTPLAPPIRKPRSTQRKAPTA
jgi:hypothetical protein